MHIYLLTYMFSPILDINHELEITCVHLCCTCVCVCTYVVHMYIHAYVYLVQF